MLLLTLAALASVTTALGAELAGAEAPAPTSQHQVFLYDFNQTLLDPILAATTSSPGFGIANTSDLTYIHANLSNFNRNGWPYAPILPDFDLARCVSRT